MKIEISHNPFLVETTVEVDGQRNLALQEKFSGRLQMWVEGMFAEIYNSLGQPDNIELEFQGVEADYEDIQLAAEQANQELGLDIGLKHHRVKSVEERVDLLEKLIQEAKSATIKGINTKDLEAAYRNSMDSDFHMQVIATMSSGKSTVINSLLGTELLPAANQATTARISRIYDEDALAGKRFEGEAKGDDGKAIHERQPVNNECLTEWNSQQNIKEISLYGDIPAVQKSAHTRLVLTDTPGPNNSQDSEHFKVTEAALQDEKKPMIVYVLNGEQLGINDDKNLLNQVRKAREKSGKQSGERFIFLVNKIDKFDPEKAETVDGVLNNARNYLKENGIHSPILMPVSAQLALLARKSYNNEKMTRTEKKDLNHLTDTFFEADAMHLLQYMNVSPSVKRNIKKQLQDISDSEMNEDKNRLKTAEIHSGIPVLEAMLNEYLVKYSIPDRISTAYESIANYLKELNESLEEYSKAALESEEKKKEADKNIKLVGEKIKSGEAAEKFREQIKSKPIEVGNKLKKEINAIGHKSENEINRIVTDLSGRIESKNLAERKIKEATDAYEYLRNEIIVAIESTGKQAYEYEVRFLRDQFKKFVSELFDISGKDFSFSTSAALLPSMEMDLDGVSLDDAKYSERIKVGEEAEWFGDNSKWYNPFSWREKKAVYQTETGFDLQKIADQVQAICAEDNHTLIKKALTHLEDKIKETRLGFIARVKATLERSVTAQLAEMDKVMSDKQYAEEKFKEAQAAIQWIESFKNKLKPIYELGVK